MKRYAWIVAASMGLGAAALAAPAPLRTTELGHGPTVLFLHSMGGTRNTWMPTVQKLIGSYHVVLADLPGHGGTPLPEPFSLAAAAEQVAATLASLKAESTVVVGQGMGGVLALKALAAHPGRARGIVFIDVSLIASQIQEPQRAAMLSIMDQNYEAFLKMTFGRMGRDSLQSVQIRAQAAQVPQTTVKAFFTELLSLDATKEIQSTRVPILALGTERVWPAGRDSAAFAKQMGYDGAPSLTLDRVPDAGFLVASDRPDTLAALITGFASRVLARK
jgi:pimeloyl-ACP methyl ester carboxylesterase